MRLSRKQIEAMADAAQDTAADEFVLELDSDGKFRFGAVEVIEKVRPLGLTKLSAKNGSARRRERATA